ncbi:hypothetical protein C8F04DRAFT_1219931 [Mycena alexandri]|uniref:Macrofage activating glycoprotein n=1 Tax=Mycena alexandri TaxID=1745969 RepID=A0AAD6X9G2_9AGAR|nr:hypothetical protein C8F04DRAFT_1219931 [Mycena alexandri]
MSPAALTSSISRVAVTLLSTTTLLSVTTAQQSTYPATPLVSKHYAYPTGIPYQVDTDTQLIRGGQSGYNQCNSTTEGQTSLCQTSFLNHLDDFCLWAPMKPNSTIADTEGEEVAWCTKPGRGTRLIPPGALQGVQYMKTPAYVQVVGFIDQTFINIQAGDYGGELDPHGADLRGNPLGGLVYSTGFDTDNSYTQVMEWHNFMGGNQFCFKACDPANPDASKFCQHVYDRIGCAYNAPNDAQNGTFEACVGENQDFPGIYTENGVVMTYSQPPESLGVISTLPYQPKVPASSSCTSYTSSLLYSALASSSATPTGSSASGSGNGPARVTGSAASGSGASAGASATGATSGAEALRVGLVSGALGLLFAVVFLS